MTRFMQSIAVPGFLGSTRLGRLRTIVAECEDIDTAVNAFLDLYPDQLDAIDLVASMAKNGYVLQAELARGGMSLIYEIYNEKLERTEALKLLCASTASEIPGARTRFEREIKVLRRVRDSFFKEKKEFKLLPCPSIYEDFETDKKGMCYTMERLSGQTLYEHVSTRGGMAIEQALQVIKRLTEVFVRIHKKGIVHRDVKPSNIFVTDEPVRYVLLDFGVAAVDYSLAVSKRGEPHNREDSLTNKQGVEMIGTLAYSSKEQILKPNVADPCNDIYSLGCIFFFLITGEHAFPQATSLATALHAHGGVRPELPKKIFAESQYSFEAIDSLFQRMIASDRNERFRNAEQLLTAIDSILNELDFIRFESQVRGISVDDLATYLTCLRDTQLETARIPLVRPDPKQTLRTKEVFVPLMVREIHSEENDETDRKKDPSVGGDGLSQFGTQLCRHGFVVLIGPPGGGKTTLLKRTALAFAEGKTSDIAGWDEIVAKEIEYEHTEESQIISPCPIPIFVRMRNFATFLLETERMEIEHDPLVHFLGDFYTKQLQSHALPPLGKEFFFQLLAGGGCCLFFDGLDEVPDKLRSEIGEIVVTFAQKYQVATVGADLQDIEQPKGENYLSKWKEAWGQLRYSQGSTDELWESSEQQSKARRDFTDHIQIKLVSEIPRFYGGKLYRSNLFVISSRPKGFEEVKEPFEKLSYVCNEVASLEPSSVTNLIENVLPFVEPDFAEQKRDLSNLSKAIRTSRELTVLASNPMFCTSLVLVYKYRHATLPNRRVDVLEEIVRLLLGYWRPEPSEESSATAKDLGELVLERAKILGYVAYQMQVSEGSRTEISREQLENTLQQYFAEFDEVSSAECKVQAERFIRFVHENISLLVEMEPSTYAFAHEGFREYFAANYIVDRELWSEDDQFISYIDDPTWEQIYLMAVASSALNSRQREKIVDKWLTLVEFSRLEDVEYNRRLILLGKATFDMGRFLSPKYRGRIQERMRQYIDNSRMTPENRLEVAYTLDALYSIASYEFLLISKGPSETREVYIAKFLTTNRDFQRFLESDDFPRCLGSKSERKNGSLQWEGDLKLWEYPWSNNNPRGKQQIYLRNKSRDWLHDNEASLIPKFWFDSKFGIAHPGLPVVGVSWYEANAFCQWLLKNWKTLEEAKYFPNRLPKNIRLPCEADWQKAQEIHSQYDYDQNEHNISGQMDRTTPVHMYVKKEEPLADFIGNVWEWQADPYDPTLLAMNIRGGAYDSHRVDAEMRSHRKPECREADVGFRIVIEFAY